MARRLYDGAKEGQTNEVSYMFPKAGFRQNASYEGELRHRGPVNLGCGVGYYKSGRLFRRRLKRRRDCRSGTLSTCAEITKAVAPVHEPISSDLFQKSARHRPSCTQVPPAKYCDQSRKERGACSSVAELSPRSRHGASPPTWQSCQSCYGGTVVLDVNLSIFATVSCPSFSPGRLKLPGIRTPGEPLRRSSGVTVAG